MNLETLLQDHRLYHSELQQDYFITTRAGGTLYGQYKQSLRELYKRFKGLKGLYYNRDEIDIDIEELEYKMPMLEDQFEIKRAKLKVEKKKLDRIELVKSIEDTEREFKRFYQQSAGLKEQLGDLTEEKVNELDKEMWMYKIKESAFVDYISVGRLKNTTVELIGCLPMDDRRKLLADITNKPLMDHWYWNERNKSVDIKEISNTINIDVHKLLNGGALNAKE